eukprot:gnl/MRDRNA2_/MRDRNA2_37707_c0_seq1.p1 gnl/MRDRNA2_/MRDRNA2_37707_c0~~gnl/MRDRNA2_/MRDRNA2_37707_c0_seq1.p1  ORF type:complete len:743 (+),score=80.33 gnl/MRDRNA2_/MRDRNA2_37707_c0_seq1:214-2442(+)
MEGETERHHSLHSLSLEALRQFDALSVSNDRTLTKCGNSKASNPQEASSGDSRSSSKSATSGRARSRKPKQHGGDKRKSSTQKRTAVEKQKQSVRREPTNTESVSTSVSFPKSQSSDEVWNRMFDANASTGTSFNHAEQKRQQLRSLARMEKKRQCLLKGENDIDGKASYNNSMTLPAARKFRAKFHTCPHLSATDIKFSDSLLPADYKVDRSKFHTSPELSTPDSNSSPEPSLHSSETLPETLPDDQLESSDSCLLTDSPHSFESQTQTPQDSHNCCWAGIQRFLTRITSKSTDIMSPHSLQSTPVDLWHKSLSRTLPRYALECEDARKSPRSTDDGASTAVPTGYGDLSELGMSRRPSMSESDGHSDDSLELSLLGDDDFHQEAIMPLEEDIWSDEPQSGPQTPTIQGELRALVRDAPFEHPSVEVLLKNLAHTAHAPQSSLVIPSLLKLVTLCEYGDKTKKDVVRTFKINNGVETLLKVAHNCDDTESMMVKLMIGAVISLVLCHNPDAESLLRSSPVVNKNVVMLFLQCIIDLDNCDARTRSAAPLCLTSILPCLCEMVHNGNLLAMQLLTKGIIRRCLKLLESAPNFKEAKELTQSQYSALLCAGFQFLDTIATRGSETSALLVKELVKERVIPRSLTIMLSSHDAVDRPEFVSLKSLISSLCTRSDSASSQLSTWISQNFRDPEVTMLAMEVCMSCLGHCQLEQLQQIQRQGAHHHSREYPRSRCRRSKDKQSLSK